MFKLDIFQETVPINNACQLTNRTTVSGFNFNTVRNVLAPQKD